MKMSVLSTQFFPVQISSVVSGAPYDPTNDTVQFAFVAKGVEPGSGDWNVGQWDDSSGPYYTAKVLVGPLNGGVSLGVGNYVAWCKITDNPEVPVIKVGTLEIQVP